MNLYFIYISTDADNDASINRAKRFKKNILFINNTLFRNKSDLPDYSRLTVSAFDKSPHARFVLEIEVGYKNSTKVHYVFIKTAGDFFDEGNGKDGPNRDKRQGVRKTDALGDRATDKEPFTAPEDTVRSRGVDDRGKFSECSEGRWRTDGRNSLLEIPRRRVEDRTQPSRALRIGITPGWHWALACSRHCGRPEFRYSGSGGTICFGRLSGTSRLVSERHLARGGLPHACQSRRGLSRSNLDIG
jgi:hypothetical protein